jgi:hypothetical protein
MPTNRLIDGMIQRKGYQNQERKYGADMGVDRLLFRTQDIPSRTGADTAEEAVAVELWNSAARAVICSEI